MSESPVTIGATTGDYLAVVLYEFFAGSADFEVAPDRLHAAVRDAIERGDAMRVFEGIDFDADGTPTFSRGLAAAMSNLRAAGATERVDRGAAAYRRNPDGPLAEYAEQAKRLLTENALDELSRIAERLRLEADTADETESTLRRRVRRRGAESDEFRRAYDDAAGATSREADDG